MNNTENIVSAKFNSRGTWIALWVFAFAQMMLALRALSLIKPGICIAMCVTALVFCALGTLVGVCPARTVLEVGEKTVCFKSFIGKQMYIPLDGVTGIKKSLLGTVCIYAPSCSIKCCFVANCDEIVNTIKEKLENR